ncbi:unnamed protein product [Protopolystoma xenopodis]|uniref:Uncharacterized protein n=1 Tax=Protopolystoma xenopodis TaxID=117903 RepID=A0A3S4ZZ16_9PLAT|nr:unnamed protein product [Protopolystoma xenopodis]
MPLPALPSSSLPSTAPLLSSQTPLIPALLIAPTFGLVVNSQGTFWPGVLIDCHSGSNTYARHPVLLEDLGASDRERERKRHRDMSADFAYAVCSSNKGLGLLATSCRAWLLQSINQSLGGYA